MIENKNILEGAKGVYPFKPGGGNLGSQTQKSKRLDESLGKYSLTEKQAIILKFIASHIDQVGFPPTVRQIALYYGISAKAAHDHLKAICKKEYIRLFPGSARGIELLKLPDSFDESLPGHRNFRKNSDFNLENIIEVPLLGAIAAGTPILAEENVESNLPFPKSFLPNKGNMFALRVRGDSMEKAGIFDGDIAVIQEVSDISEVSNGEVVAAMLDGDATLKTFVKKEKSIILKPQNDQYKPILLEKSCFPSIIGKLVGVYRKY